MFRWISLYFFAFCLRVSPHSCYSPISFVKKEFDAGYEEASRKAVQRYCAEKKLTPERLAAVDFTQPSCCKRLAIYDIRTGARKKYLAAHASKTGT